MNQPKKDLKQYRQEIKELKQWKREAVKLLNPIFKYGQSKKAGISPGRSITHTVLERCKKYDASVALLEKVLKSNSLRDLNLYNEIKTFLK